MDLTHYRTLGNSGLAVSPLALGTMTFGADRWGTGEKTSRSVFNAYIEAGGNFVDSADVYSAGHSEEMLGGFIAERGLRDTLVVSTKSGFSRSQGAPNCGGSGAKNIRLGLEGSLRRLRTDYIDMFWVHVWDRFTPAEEVLQTLVDAKRSGKILHYGFSNTPGWYIAKVATLAQAHGLPAPVGLQFQYSLIERGVELDILPAGNEFGLGMVPWSPLGGGLLSGKYGREMLAESSREGGLPDKAGVAQEGSDGRLNGDNPFGGMLFTERNFDVVDVVRDIAQEIGRSMAEVALAWVVNRPGVSSVLVGASRVVQLSQNIAALDIMLTREQQGRLDQVSELAQINPYFIFQLPSDLIRGVPSVTSWKAVG
ncbi:aldo/keto reductase [Halomonas salipaludis]|uniref:Aldo/keto reductase n=1 Tax=Halomonas salipaludis TaxID=2032625 RepID=A0A2A2EUN9_9GAMM|nr:aldo/keto reductase [Halomonas salipaludis]PAU76115.1 aldo/keto reductase [Halomonas salipaludis]